MNSGSRSAFSWRGGGGVRGVLQTDEETHSGTSNADCTKGKGGANHILSRGQGSYQRSLNDRKGRLAIASVLCKSCPTRPGGQLHPHGKIGISLAQRKQTAEKLEGYDIQYRPKTSIKGQILADFIVERPDEESPDELMAEPEELPQPWTLFTDGSSYIHGSGAGLILTNPEGVEFTYAMRFRFEASNNESEYEALIAVSDCRTNGRKKPSSECRLSPCSKPGQWLLRSKGVSKASTVLVEELKEKSIHEKEVLAIVEEEGQTWITPICEYLTKEILPKDKKKARVVHRKASQYTMINGT
ncbi:reverse transcriptase domain-containing protein [Tanacetum coccineum]